MSRVWSFHEAIAAYCQLDVMLYSYMGSVNKHIEVSGGKIRVSPDTRLALAVLTVLLFLSTTLVLVSFLFHLYSLRALESSALISLRNFTNVNHETSLPTWFNSKLLFVASLLLAFLYLSTRHTRPSDGVKWGGLSIIFLYLSMDEAAVIHERVAGVFARQFGFTGIFYYGWVLPFSLLVLLFLVFYAPFFLHLPRRTRNLVALAGTLYVGGALGAEVVSSLIHQSGDRETLAFVSTFTLEEWLEMTGVSLFIFALLDYTARYLSQAVASGQPLRTREKVAKRSNGLRRP